MKCMHCKAFGVDDLGFRGCLVEHTMEDLPCGLDGCHRKKETIVKEIAEVKANNPRAKDYRWIHDKEG